MFRITKDPSSGSLVQCLAKNYKNDSIVCVDMDMVGGMAAYCVCSSVYREVLSAFIYSELHTDWSELQQWFCCVCWHGHGGSYGSVLCVQFSV
jgi:hypothetical protein